MNASLNVGVGVMAGSKTRGMTVSGVCVGTTTGAGDEVGNAPPSGASGVGVTNCPHRDAVPPQAASKNDAAINRLISRFTK